MVDEVCNKYLFLAQWSSKNLKYPVYSGQSLMEKSKTCNFTINNLGKSQRISVEFKPYQSIMLKISTKGKIEFVDISFIPKDPVILPREPQRMNF